MGHDGLVARDPRRRIPGRTPCTVWGWKRNTLPLSPKEQQELIDAGKLRREESPLRLQNADGGKPILLNNGSCFWNDSRKTYVMIASEAQGATELGEVWYGEADGPEGLWWVHARIYEPLERRHGACDAVSVSARRHGPTFEAGRPGPVRAGGPWEGRGRSAGAPSPVTA